MLRNNFYAGVFPSLKRHKAESRHQHEIAPHRLERAEERGHRAR